MNARELSNAGAFHIAFGSFVLRLLEEKDKDACMEVWKSTSVAPELFKRSEYVDILWKDAFDEDSGIVYVVQKDGSVVGSFVFKDCKGGIEIGLDIIDREQNKGIASTVIPELLRKIREVCPEVEITAKVYSDNDICRHVVEKLGAVKVSEELSEFDQVMKVTKEQFGDDFLERAGIDLSEEGRNHIDIYRF